MAIKTLNNILKFASQEKAEKMIISNNSNDLSCFMQWEDYLVIQIFLHHHFSLL